MSFIKNSKHRNIYKIGIAYLAIAWFLVQMMITLTAFYNLPGILVGGLIFMLIGGYPLIMMLAWAYEATHRTRGWEKDNEIANKELGAGSRFPIFIGVLVGLSIAVLLLDIFVLRVVNAPNSDEEEVVGVIESSITAYTRFIVALPATLPRPYRAI